jgi:hypothetical protein
VGQTWNYQERYNYYRKVACIGQVNLYNSFKKYGFDKHKFEILYVFTNHSQEELDFFEICLIEYYKSKGCSLNIRDGGSRGKIANETKLKISKSRKGKCVGEKNPQFGKERSELHRKRLSDSRQGKGLGENNGQFGKERSELHRKRLSDSLKGRDAWNKGRKMSSEQKEKISRSRKGKCMGNKHTIGIVPWNKGLKFKKEI